MTLIEQIQTDVKTSIKEGNAVVRDALRLLQSQLKNTAIDVGKDVLEFVDEEVIQVIRKEIKKREDAMQMYKDNDRQELYDREAEEKAIFEKYVPAQMSEEQVRAEVEKIIESAGGADNVEFGTIMKQAMQELNGRADGKLVNTCVRSLLGM